MSSTWVAVRLLPQSNRGWVVKARQHSTRSFVTVNLAVRFSWSIPEFYTSSADAKAAKLALMLSQIVYDGITFKSLPPGPRPQRHCASHGRNHGSNQDTLLELMRLMQDMMDNEEGHPGRK